MSARARAASALSALAAAGLILAGCAAPGGDPAPAGAANGTAGGGSLDPARCLIGEWEIVQDQMQLFYDAVAAASSGDLGFTVTGATGLSFEESHYRYTPGFTLELVTDGMSGTGTVTGSLRGDYAVAGGIISTSHDDNDLTMRVALGGIEMDASGILGAVLATHPFNEAPYECTADGVVVEFSTGTGRVPITLTPAR